MQLVELQGVLPILRQHNISLFAISYDSVSALGEFSERNEIEYPLLADEGSTVIRALGLLDEDLEAHHAEFGGTVREEQRGVCYPAVFILDEHGRVGQRRIQRNYRVRESGASLLAQALEIHTAADAPEVQRESPSARVAARLDSPTYWRHQRLHVEVDISLPAGAHVIAPPTRGDYTTLSVEVGADQAVIGEPIYPPSTPYTLEGLNEELWVYQGDVRVVVPFELIMERGDPMGDKPIDVRVRFQSCTDVSCDPPEEVALTLTVHERPGVS